KEIDWDQFRRVIVESACSTSSSTNSLQNRPSHPDNAVEVLHPAQSNILHSQSSIEYLG
ncbi:hypothetical protein AVEN_198575-1, partial [Araneus ventricosus]